MGGWLQRSRGPATECRAPSTYQLCASVQQFNHMSPYEKQLWESSCQAWFPCRSRATCTHDWSASCPAEWYSINGGETCLAPSTYAGTCSSALHGLIHESPERK